MERIITINEFVAFIKSYCSTESDNGACVLSVRSLGEERFGLMTTIESLSVSELEGKKCLCRAIPCLEEEAEIHFEIYSGEGVDFKIVDEENKVCFSSPTMEIMIVGAG